MFPQCGGYMMKMEAPLKSMLDALGR